MAATVGAEDIETVYDVLLEMAETSPAVHDKHIQAQHKGLHMETRSNLGKNHSRLSTQLKVALAVIIVTLIAIIVFLGIREGTGLLSSERKPGGNDGTHSWIPNESGEFNKTNGGWSVWAGWTDCSATCNTGVQTRQRQCNNPVPSSGGQYCQGSQMDVVLCNKQQCPQRKVAFVAQHSARANEYGQNQKVIFAKVNYNNGGGYDNQTGIFTAPETGTYLFSFYILSRPNTSAHVSLVVEGRHRGEADAAGYTSAGNSDVVYLDKGKPVWIQTSNFQSQYYISAYKSQFLGALLD